MDVPKVLDRINDAMTVRRVYGEPVERDGVVVIPAAAVQGGGGGGSGGGTDGRPDGGHGEGSGAGWGAGARPVGAWVIRDGDARWEPAIDVSRAIVGAQVVAVLALLTLRTWMRRRRRR
jgi:uncharacterized spore protein YtfJ